MPPSSDATSHRIPLSILPLLLGAGRAQEAVVDAPEAASAWSVATLRALALGWGLDVLSAILILIAGWIVAGWAARTVRRVGRDEPRFDETISTVFARIVRIGLILITVLAVLGQFGVETTSFVALLGAAGLAIGLALQGALSNVAAGVMLLGLRPFKLGDAVNIAGQAGAIEDIGLFTTRIRTWDGVIVHMPNSNIVGGEIVNYSQAALRRADIVVGIGYGDDMDAAIRVLSAMLEEEERVLAEPEPVVTIDGLGDSSVDVLLRYWTQPSDLLATRWDLTKRAKERLDAAGIEIPFPQRDVHLIQDAPSEPRAAG